ETPTSAPKSLHETAVTAPSAPPAHAAAVPVASPRRAAPPAHAAVAAATRGAWAVQLGSFKDRGNALKLARHWKAKGYAAYLSTTGSGPRALHRVRIGPYADRGAALHAIAALASHGARANLVPPGR
ncbi:MAG: SPOR domain-containing protein, partial [Gammaproteobacteria bacterium]|nr:SPOR domain-containing protein [Gammaproteobacteria bacterium]